MNSKRPASWSIYWLFEIKRIPVVNIWVDVQYLNAGLLLSRQVYLCIHITGIAVLIQATAALGSDISYAGCRDKAESLSSRPWTHHRFGFWSCCIWTCSLLALSPAKRFNAANKQPLTARSFTQSKCQGWGWPLHDAWHQADKGPGDNYNHRWTRPVQKTNEHFLPWTERRNVTAGEWKWQEVQSKLEITAV